MKSPSGDASSFEAVAATSNSTDADGVAGAIQIIVQEIDPGVDVTVPAVVCWTKSNAGSLCDGTICSRGVAVRQPPACLPFCSPSANLDAISKPPRSIAALVSVTVTAYSRPGAYTGGTPAIVTRPPGASIGLSRWHWWHDGSPNPPAMFGRGPSRNAVRLSGAASKSMAIGIKIRTRGV